MGTVQLVDAQKRFGQHEVIKNVSLGIEDGEFVVLVGPSGCGKSTLLRLIAGLEDISGGDVRIDGQSVAHVDPAERGIAMVFQSYALYPHKTVRENMGFALQIARRSKAEIAAKVEAAADTLHLRALLDRYPRQLSGGQRQRVAIGRAIVRDPAVFLFDEPLSNLDAELRVEMRLELAQLHQRLGTTMIYVTHDQTEAMTLADKIVVLRDGQIEQVGSPLSLYDDPDNTFVATFIGSPRMNMLSVAARASEGGAQLTLPGGSTTFVPGIKPNTATIMMGVRPERISLRAGQGMPFEVSVVEHLGGTTYLYGTLADGTRLTVESDDRDVAAGDTLQVGIAPGDCFLFDQDGQRLRPGVA